MKRIDKLGLGRGFINGRIRAQQIGPDGLDADQICQHAAPADDDDAGDDHDEDKETEPDVEEHGEDGEDHKQAKANHSQLANRALEEVVAVPAEKLKKLFQGVSPPVKKDRDMLILKILSAQMNF